MNTLTLVNVCILCSIAAMLIIYPIIIYSVIKNLFVPALLGDVVGKTLKNVDKLADRQIKKIDNEVNEFYEKVKVDTNIMRIQTIASLNLIIEDHVDKLIKILESAIIKVNFDN